MCLGLVIIPRFYPRICKFLVYVINSVCACVRTSAEDGNFPREGGGCMYLMILFESFMFWFVRENIIPGTFGFAGYYIRSAL